MSRLGNPADVRDHCFGAGRPFTVGVEEEYMLLDPRRSTSSRAPSGSWRPRLAATSPPTCHRSCSSRWSSSTPASATARAEGQELRELRRIGQQASRPRKQRLRLGSAGTHPFSLFERQRITRRDRYRMLIDELQYAGRRELIYGLHMHVGRRRSRTAPSGRQRAARAPRRADGTVGEAPRSGAASRPASPPAGI